ncbi:hypothetical protein [Aeromicrobium sp. Root495]|uniref:hypothetical protein n=1 Tax=Aeromicrobium sp. Root495 TaxID=1736550 RepID=UPI000AA0D2A8|nr:hypothetical protein [Aeromicrobium sp. Root495]
MKAPPETKASRWPAPTRFYRESPRPILALMIDGPRLEAEVVRESADAAPPAGPRA